tara:strand:- start:775 stop:1020 length:246 start_codon:yes stop_codon:yes gene_type:complete
MNKTQRREKSAHQAMDVALKALERIEAHEKECGERWAEAVFELKYLREATDAHSARWEKLAWLILGTFVATAVVHFVDLMV